MPPATAYPPFSSSIEHVLAELERIDLLVRLQVWRARQRGGDEAFRGLTISDQEVDTAFDLPLGAPPWSGVPLPPELAGLPDFVHRLTVEIEERRLESRRAGIDLRLERLAAAFGLTRFEVDVLLIALAPELDLRYERLFAWLQDDVTRKRPSVDLALHLLCDTLADRVDARARFAPDAPLVHYRLVHLHTDPPSPHASLLTQHLKLDDRIAGWLHGDDGIDPRLAAFARRVRPAVRLEDLVLSTERRARLARLRSDRGLRAKAGMVVHLSGPPGVGKETAAEAVCRPLRRSLLVIDLPALLSLPDDQLETSIQLALREARLVNAAVYWAGFDALLAPEKRTAHNRVMRALEPWRGLAFLAGEKPWEPVDGLRDRRFVRIELELPDVEERTGLWARALRGKVEPDQEIDLEKLAERFRFTAEQIRDAAATAIERASWREPVHRRVTMDDLWEACRRHGTPQLGSLARKVPTPFGWGDLVMSKDRLERLREVIHHARYRHVVLEQWGFDRKLATGRGLSMLFSGAPGTGKTMAAGVIARELELDLYQIDLSSVVSKYIGETEKHLAKIFDEAERAHAVLFFDEADALFGKRSEVRDAHDRYANIETSYLLQRVEAYDGVVILATNFSRNLDEAFVRRIRFILEFAVPDERERRRIWEQIWPAGVPRAPELDLAFMAKRFELAGGYIRNVALSSAFLAAAEGAPVGMRHLLHAVRREYQKMGKMLDEAQFVYRR
jgi:SpoVK/Ycf46/Vps4 family AAA+-type ATPase